jgi:hypothetical protein
MIEIRCRVLVVLQAAALFATPAMAQPSAGIDANELSRQATDPTASLMSFNFISDFRTSFYEVDDTGFEFRFQPVIPFKAWGVSNILRTVVPYQVDGPGDEGLKSTSIFDLVVVPLKWGRLGFGPVMNLSESTSGDVSKFSIGPAIGAVAQLSKKLSLGVFNQNLFASEIGLTQIQPIIAYQLGSGWALSAGDLQFVYDFEGDQWVSLPIGFQIGKVQRVAGQAMAPTRRSSCSPSCCSRRGADEDNVDGGRQKEQVHVEVHDSRRIRHVPGCGSGDHGGVRDAARAAGREPGRRSRPARCSPRG